MSPHHVVDAMRVGWLTLAFMMLLSRVIFQAHGAEWMRAFLVRWQRGGVKRVWGGIGLAYGAFLCITGLPKLGSVRAFEVALFVVLLVVLFADGLVNVLPAGFETFKDRMQQAWVSRQRTTGRAGDRYLFATVNALLALAAAGAAAVVIAYRPISAAVIAIAVASAVLLTVVLIGAVAPGGPRRVRSGRTSTPVR
jgi:hypothetical protein